MPAWQQLPIGARFERLIVLADLGTPQRRRLARVRCDCGVEKTVDWPHLKYGKIKSCGCLLPDVLDARNRTHGQAHTRTYKIWSGMLQRSMNVNPKRASGMSYKHVTVCARWRSFDNFLADMGEAPDGKSIDRRDGLRGYEPSNCRWATTREQRENAATARLLSFQGQTMTIGAWTRCLGLSPSTLYWRINRGWPLERAFVARGIGPECAGRM